MTPDIDTIRERHHANGWGADDTCWACGQEWPCDTRRVLDAKTVTARLDLDSLREFIYAPGPALDAARADADRLAAAMRLDASEVVAVEGQPPITGTDLLRLVALLLDKRDHHDGNLNRTVQADLRRWADRIDAALAAHEEAR